MYNVDVDYFNISLSSDKQKVLMILIKNSGIMENLSQINYKV